MLVQPRRPDRRAQVASIPSLPSPAPSNRGCRTLAAGLRAPLLGRAGREPRPRLATLAAPSLELGGEEGRRRVGERAQPAGESGGGRDLRWPEKWMGMEVSVIGGVRGWRGRTE